MGPLEAVSYGLVQGLGEFLPISSSAHLVVLPWAAGWEDPGLAFDVALHLGTLVALLVYFRSDIWRLARAFVSSLMAGRLPADPDGRLAGLVLIASIPGALAGLAFEHAAEESFRVKGLVALMMIVMGLALWVADRWVVPRQRLDGLTWKQAILVGVAQAAAIVPGVSRSGSTIAAARALGFDREASARFSFLLAIPIVAGAGALQLPKLFNSGGLDASLLLGLAVSALSGYVAIDMLLRLVKTRSYLPFVVYRLAFGAAVWAAIWSGLRPAL